MHPKFACVRAAQANRKLCTLDGTKVNIVDLKINKNSLYYTINQNIPCPKAPVIVAAVVAAIAI